MFEDHLKNSMTGQKMIVMAAWLEGKPIQYRGLTPLTEWTNCNAPAWNWAEKEYRIAEPTPAPVNKHSNQDLKDNMRTALADLETEIEDAVNAADEVNDALSNVQSYADDLRAQIDQIK